MFLLWILYSFLDKIMQVIQNTDPQVIHFILIVLVNNFFRFLLIIIKNNWFFRMEIFSIQERIISIINKFHALICFYWVQFYTIAVILLNIFNQSILLQIFLPNIEIHFFQILNVTSSSVHIHRILRSVRTCRRAIIVLKFQ